MSTTCDRGSYQISVLVEFFDEVRLGKRMMQSRIKQYNARRMEQTQLMIASYLPMRNQVTEGIYSGHDIMNNK